MRTKCGATGDLWLLLLSVCVVASGFCPQPALADHRSDAQPANFFAGHLRTSTGDMLSGDSPADTELYRAGTDPLVPLTDVNGDPITWGQYNGAHGMMSISHVPGGGSAVSAQFSGLIPGELYSMWAGYFDPAFPFGRYAFGAMTENGMGTDHYGVADVDGNLSLDVVHQAGPGTVEGEILSYAPDNRTGYDVGLALHFGDYPEKELDPIAFLAPGDIQFWSLATVTHFPVPEPSSLTLMVLVGCAVVGRRTRRPIR